MARSISESHVMKFRTPVVWIVQTAVVGIFAGFMAYHWDYYGLPRVDRPFHAAHEQLRSSGFTGLWMGVGAATLFVLNLGYLVRKRLVRINWLGALRHWMNIHVVTGIVGAGCVAVHMAMAPSSTMGTLALFALCVTVVTGIVGRTIYIRVPRSAEGRELEFKQVQAELDRFRLQLELAGVQADWLHESKPQVTALRTSLLGCFMAMVVGDRQRREDYRRLKRQILGTPRLKASTGHILPMAKAYCMHWQWFTRYYELRNLIASWRFFHRWLAVLMLFVVLGHIVVAIRFGSLSLWGGSH